ncbi:MAG: two-component regulator propeller domain-containing protein [Candidatus Kryptoniota bacterium]
MLVSFEGVSSAFALDRHRSIAQYVQNTWTFQSGLPANGVNAILQTRDGYLWLGTSAGLFRFDGVSFTEVSTEPQDAKASQTITTFCEIHDGSLWIGTASAGLRVLKAGKIFCYDSKNGFFNTGIRKIFESRAGHLFVATNIGLFLFKDGKFQQLFLDQNFINGIAEDPQNRIWVGTVDGIRIFDDNGSTKPTVTALRNGLPYPSVLNVLGDREGNMWVGTYGGLARFKDGKATTYSTANDLVNDRILAIFQDRDGQLWVGTEKGIERFVDGVWTNFTKSDGLTDNEVLSFAEDHEHSLWVGTGNGLNQFEDPNITTYTTEDGLADNHVSIMIQSSDSSIYIMSDQSTVMTRLKDGKFTKYNKLNIPGGPAFAARDGSIWINAGGGLLNFKNGKLKQFGSKSGVSTKWISAITEDDKSIIFYADHAGLFRLVDGHAIPYLLKNGKEYPKDDYIVCFFYQKNGTLWIGRGNSIAKIQDGTLSTFMRPEEGAGNWTSSFYDDGKGGLWISSMPGGLILLKDGKFTVFNTGIGLFSNEISFVLGDNRGGIWMTSGKGIGYVKRQELEDFAAGKVQKIHSIEYGSADGIKTNSFFSAWQPAGLYDYEGHIWFSTKNGAVMIDPKDSSRNKLSPPVLIENVIADQRAIPTDEYTTLSAGTDKLEFHYVALSFKVPQRVMFKYRLEGYDRGWVDAGTRREAFYTNLSPGDYEFQVIACNNDGVWNVKGADFFFRLKPHFYQTYWFFVLIVVLVGGAAFGAYRLRVWQLLKREKELSDRIQEALAHIKTLGGLIPICSNCKKIRGDKGYWEHLEKYIQTHSEARFSHGLCPECMQKLYPEFDKTGVEKGTDT